MTSAKNQPLRFFLLIALSLMLQQGLMLADAAVVGNLLGKELFAAIEVQTALLRVPISFAAGFSSGITVTLSYLLGKKEKAGSAAVAGLLLSCGIGLIITMGVQLLGQRLLDWMAVPAVIHQASLDYLRVYISGTVFSLLFNACIGIFHAHQDAKTPLFLMMFSFALNLLLDLLLVPMFPGSLLGAAAATVVSQAVVAISAVALLKKRAALSKPIGTVWKELLSIAKAGFPVGAQAFVFAAANAIWQQQLNVLGMEAIAAWSLCNKLDTPVWIAIDSMSVTLTTFCARAYGGDHARSVKGLVHRICGAGFSAIIVMVLLLLAIPELLGRLIIPDAVVRTDAGGLIRLLAPFYLVYACGESAAALFRSRANTVIPFCAVVLQCAARVGLLFLLPEPRGIRSFVLVYVLSVCLYSLLLTVPVLFRWKNRKLNDAAASLQQKSGKKSKRAGNKDHLQF